MRLQESGIIDHLGRSSVERKIDQCMIRNIESQSQDGNPLTLFALVSAFVILGIGFGLSLLVFIIELAVFKFSHRTITKKTAVKPRLNKMPARNEISKDIKPLNAVKLIAEKPVVKLTPVETAIIESAMNLFKLNEKVAKINSPVPVKIVETAIIESKKLVAGTLNEKAIVKPTNQVKTVETAIIETSTNPAHN